MSTSLVAGRVDSSVQERANIYIRRAGLTQAEVIRRVWQNIAVTGTVPEIAETPADAVSPLTRRMQMLRGQTPRSSVLESLTPAELKKELENRE